MSKYKNEICEKIKIFVDGNEISFDYLIDQLHNEQIKDYRILFLKGFFSGIILSISISILLFLIT